jgi:hypothetical protein
MSEINANFVVQQISATFVTENPTIEFTPNTQVLNLYAGAPSLPAGTNSSVQFNNANVLDGTNAFIFDLPSNTAIVTNLTVSNDTNLGAIGNITITGGTNGYAMMTDGAGNLSWQSIANANYANSANLANYVVQNAQSNITSVGTLTGLTVAGNVNLGSVSNLVITGGTNGYVLQTDGVGNLSWVAQSGGGGNGSPGGSNTQIQYNNNGVFAGNTGFTFNNTNGNVSVPVDLIASGNVNATYFIGNGSQLTGLATSTISNGTSNVRVFSSGNVTTSVSATSNVLVVTALGINVSGPVTSTRLISNVATGTAPLTVTSTTEVANLNSRFANVVTNPAQSNITSVGTLTSLAVTGNSNLTGITSVVTTKETINLIGAQTGTYNFDLIGTPIQYSTANATANIIVNFRGNSTVSANTLIANSESVTATYVMTTGSSVYNISSIEIDGSARAISWASNITPLPFANTTTAYTFTIIKTATTPTYKVLGSATRYG